MTRFDRRALFATGAAAALLAATGVSLSAAPRRGGSLRLAVPRVADGLTPVARAALYETLTELTPDGLLTGRLATRWEASDEGRIWDLTLRSDVLFHDGAGFMAEDAAASLAGRLPGLVDAASTGAGRVRLTLAQPDPQLPIRLADPSVSMHPGWDPQGHAQIGTGTYALRHQSAGGGMVAARFEDHYSDQAGWADRIDIIAMSDPAGRAAALEQGLVDAAVAPAFAGLADRSDLTCLPDDHAPALVTRNTVGHPAALSGSDTRLAERLWLV